MSGLISLLIFILVLGLIAGLIVWLIQAAPFIPEPFKQWCVYLVMVIAILMVLVRALPLLGVSI